MRKLIGKMTIAGVALAILCVAVGLAGSRTSRESLTSATNTLEDIPGVKDIRGYQQWTRVNLVSLPLHPLNAGLCRAPMPGEIISSPANPHREPGKFFAV